MITLKKFCWQLDFTKVTVTKKLLYQPNSHNKNQREFLKNQVKIFHKKRNCAAICMSWWIILKYVKNIGSISNVIFFTI